MGSIRRNKWNGGTFGVLGASLCQDVFVYSCGIFLSLLVLIESNGFCTAIPYNNSFEKLNECFQIPWEEQAEKCGLSDEAISLLRKNRFVICDKNHDGQDELYADPKTSYCSFVTTDHMLKVYHRLFQESFCGIEENMADALPVVLLGILESLDESRGAVEAEKELKDRSYRTVQFVVGVPLKLMDSSFSYGEKELDLAIEKEVAKILKAEGKEQIGWPSLSGDENSIVDYGKFSPHGLFLSSESLSQYYRAYKWLQTVQFYIENEELLLSAVMIAESTRISHWHNGNDVFKNHFQYIFKEYPVVSGTYGYNNLNRLERDSWYFINNCWGDLQLIKEYLREGQSNSGEFPHSYYSSSHWYLPFYKDSLRIISDHRMASDVLFLDNNTSATSCMTGLSIPASFGSEFAINNLDSCQIFKKDMRDIHLELRPNALSGFLPHPGYQYIKTLEALTRKPDFDYPEFMRTEAWDVKNCNTLLMSWFLNSSDFKTIAMNDLSEKRPGRSRASRRGYTDTFRPALIEPNPEFYRELESLTRDTRIYLDHMGAFGKELVPGKLPTDVIVNNDSSNIMNDNDDSKMKLLKKWEDFEQLCRRCESQSQNQLRFSRMKKEDSVSLEDYINNLRTLFLPGGMRLYNTDEFVKAFPLYVSDKDGEVPISAFGKSRQMYVLYPWNGHYILCEGSVSPYYEFVAHSDFSDKDWMNRLNSDEPPTVPSWLAPVVEGQR